MKNVLFKSKIRNAKMKILQVASALTICLGGIFGSTLPVAANTVGTNVYVYCKNQTSTWNWGTGETSETLYLIVGAANSNKTAMNYSITNNGNNQNVSATTSGGNTYNGYAYAVKMSIPATAATLSYNANGGSVSP